MTDKQFIFSVVVGGLLLVLGAAITTQATIGIGLLGLGLAILALTFFTRHKERDRSDDANMALVVEHHSQRASLDT